ncbi:hypothetical protein [Prescottella agglutinans]|uniref:hypothetical protein n=1 Tax=Prescottella agglutinans TaxID=1644129 RepID=UPI0013E2E690|nr:hypothetical protein [Prescottella agglutinans]
MSLVVALAALVVALIALFRDIWEHRQSRSASILGLMFQAGRSSTVTIENQDRPRRKFTPSVAATGPGMRYDVRTYLWVDDLVELKWKDQRQNLDRFDNTSGRLSCEIEIYDDEAEQVWFGLGYNETSVAGTTNKDHVRSEFVRSNLGRNEVQVWRWYRFAQLRKGWQRQTRFAFWGGGVPKPLGRWKRVETDDMDRRHFPTWDGTEDWYAN